MIRPVRLRPAALSASSPAVRLLLPTREPRRLLSQQRSSDPLRILFCGSDEVSCAAFEALDGERRRARGLVESIDVVVRPGKGVGRGYKRIREVPLKHLASQSQVPIHERDTFTGFEPPKGINLVIAVSFGLFVPPRILRAAKYGGLNVHPSFLPDLRGAAPLHHALLQNRSHAGITLQTLDEHRFDHGAVLARSPWPGVPIPPGCTVAQLTDLVKGPAAELLLEGLRRGLHVPPVVDISAAGGYEGKGVGGQGSGIRLAPKLTKGDRRIDWRGWSAAEMALRLRVLGPLWAEVTSRGRAGTERVIVRDAEEVGGPRVNGGGACREISFLGEEGPGTGTVARVRYLEEEDGAVVVGLPGGGWLRIGEVVVGGKAVRRAARALAPFAS